MTFRSLSCYINKRAPPTVEGKQNGEKKRANKSPTPDLLPPHQPAPQSRLRLQAGLCPVRPDVPTPKKKKKKSILHNNKLFNINHLNPIVIEK